MNRKNKPKVSRRKEIIKIRVETNETGTRKMERINKTKGRFFETVNKIFSQTKKKRKTQVRNEKGHITVDITEKHMTIRDYYEQLYVNKSDTLQEMNKFLEIHNPPSLSQEERDYLKG